MSKYIFILFILYNLNLLLICFIELMVKNISHFNYKNTSKFTKGKFFFDIISQIYTSKKSFVNITYAYIV
jgi:hypothetical protein